MRETARTELRAWMQTLTRGISLQDAGLATAWDGYCAAVTAEAVIESMKSGDSRRVPVQFGDVPSLYRKDMIHGSDH